MARKKKEWDVARIKLMISLLLADGHHRAAPHRTSLGGNVTWTITNIIDVISHCYQHDHAPASMRLVQASLIL